MISISNIAKSIGLGRDNLRWVNLAKGIGIILVVIGHYSPENSPSFWLHLHNFIYAFHMPLFFVLSGYLYKYKEGSYLKLLKNKIQRLVLPFFSVAVFYACFKLLAGAFVNLDYPVNYQSILNLLTNPVFSFVPLLWFVHALFGIFLIYPIIRAMAQPVPIFVLTLVVAIFVSIFNISIPIFSKAVENLPYFSLGVLFADQIFRNKFSLLCSSKAFLISTISLFFCFIAYTQLVKLSGSNLAFVSYLLGIIGAIAVISFSMIAERKISASQTNIFEIFGICSMSIYLFHTLFESAVRIAFTKFLSPSEFHFLLIALIAVIFGLAGPTLIELFILRRSRTFALIFLGIRPSNKHAG